MSLKGLIESIRASSEIPVAALACSTLTSVPTWICPAATQRNGSVQLVVSDTGIGISKSDQDNLFNQFFRAETELTNVESGTGLGLFITKSLVEAHGGEIWVESEEGIGTTVSVTFPTEAGFADSAEPVAAGPA